MAVIAEAVEPLVQAKLSALGVPEATQTRLAALASQASSDPVQAKAVFAAALPLVQGKPTVTAVEALLLAVLRLDPDNKDLGDEKLTAQAMAVIAEAVEISSMTCTYRRSTHALTLLLSPDTLIVSTAGLGARTNAN
jgi:hypothetical protein